MTPPMRRYEFSPATDMADVEATLLIAVLAVQSLHGATQVLLDGRYSCDSECHQCHINTDSVVGHDLNSIFAGLVVREFGLENCRISHGKPLASVSCVEQGGCDDREA